jgi:hypothetical protein
MLNNGNSHRFCGNYHGLIFILTSTFFMGFGKIGKRDDGLNFVADFKIHYDRAAIY